MRNKEEKNCVCCSRYAADGIPKVNGNSYCSDCYRNRHHTVKDSNLGCPYIHKCDIID